MRSLPTLALGLLLAAATFAAQAQKVAPGLWEAQMSMKSGSGQIEAQMARMQQEMAKMPPEQRKMMQDMMARQGMAMDPAKGLQTMRYCLSKEQAERGEVPADPEGRCKHEKMERSGSTMRFSFVCSNPPSRGSGEITLQGDKAYTSKMTVESSGKDGKPERVEMQQQARWVSAECGALRPVGGAR
jgi:hypothetical protein